jgi:hypothetical protein
MPSCVRPRRRVRRHAVPRVWKRYCGLTFAITARARTGICRIRTREVADYRIEAEHCLDGIGFEPAVEYIARRSAEELERGVETDGLPKLSADLREFAEFAHSLTEAA